MSHGLSSHAWAFHCVLVYGMIRLRFVLHPKVPHDFHRIYSVKNQQGIWALYVHNMNP